MKTLSIFGLSESNFIIVLIFSLIVLLSLVYLYLSFIFVDKNHVKIVERNGKFRSVIRSGWHLIVPLIDKIVAEIDTAAQVVFSTHEFSIILSDGKAYKATYFITFRVVDFEKYYYIGADVLKLLEASLTSILIKYYSNCTFKHYKDVFNIQNDEVMSLLTPVNEQFGIEISNYSLSNFYLINI